MTSLTTAVALADASPSSSTDAAGTGGPDWLMIGMFVVLAIIVFFMWRNGRRQRARAADLQAKMVPGVEVMTNFGVYGRLQSLDTVTGTAELEIAPGTVIKVHRQTLSQVVTPGDAPAAGQPRSVEEAMEIANREQAEREAATKTTTIESEPQYGERLPKDGDDKDGSKA